MGYKRSFIVCTACLVVFISYTPAWAQSTTEGEDHDSAHTPWRLDAGVTFAHFEQQVKVEIGGARGERLVTDSEIGLNVFASYNLIDYIALGLFAQFDLGARESARFAGTNANGETVTSNATGGSYWEFWAGPLVRGQWSTLFVEVGYGFGLRGDDGRTDLPSDTGDTSTALLTSPSVAWLFAVGAGVPITDALQAVLRVEYRVRYYDRRTDGALQENLVHGTQSLAPYIGIAWTF